MKIDTTIIEPTTKRNSMVIWLHGLGADSSDFSSSVPLFQLHDAHDIAFAFPSAPIKSITMNGGAETRAWFDVSGIDSFFSKKELPSGLKKSCEYIDDIITSSGVSRDRVIVGGFSQGGATALHYALSTNKPIAGVISLAGWLISSNVEINDSLKNSGFSALISHGENDNIVPFAAYERIASYLTNNSISVAKEHFPIAHEVNEAQFIFCGHFISAALGNPPSSAHLKQSLPQEQYYVLCEHGTERPGTSVFLNEKRDGTYSCTGCGNKLFTSSTKYESGTGWPSFYNAIDGALEYSEDSSMGMPRTEYHCAFCGGHQGHVFNDGPNPSGKRFCNNGVALTFEPKND